MARLPTVQADAITVAYLPAPLHNRPERIVGEVTRELEQRGGEYTSVVLGYGDCGTGGGLDRYVDEWNAANPAIPMRRLHGDHCYAIFTDPPVFAELHGDELGTFFLTDFMVVNFESLIWQGLGLDTNPELRDMYFGHYTRALYLAQMPTPDRERAARNAAERLGLRFDMRTTGLEAFQRQLIPLLERS